MSGFNNYSSVNGLRWSNKVTVPWHSLSRRVYPRTIDETLAWAEELWVHHGVYTSAIKKAVRYFMTDVEIFGEDVDYEVRQKYQEFVRDSFDINEELASIGDDFIGFGNSFTSVYQPFVRYLRCGNCGFTAPLERVIEDGSMKWDSYTFSGNCPSCRQGTTWNHYDLFKRGADPKIVRWPQQYMEVKAHPISMTKQFKINLPRYEDLRRNVMQGDMLYLAETPWEFIEAIRDNRKLIFENDEIFHMAQPQTSVSQPQLKGWGLPLFMAEFENVVLVMLLDKYVEAIATDYLVPFRVISPAAAQSGTKTNPLLNLDMGDVMSTVRTMIDEHRRNPTTWHTSPMELNYQTLGGEASQLVPVELLSYYRGQLLSSMGIPGSFFGKNGGGGGQASAAMKTASLEFKLFEREWQFFADQLNKWFTWILKKQGEQQSWEKAKGRIVPISVVEDADLRQIKLEMAAAGKVSETTAFRAIGMDWDYEQERIIQEQAIQNRRMEEAQKKQEEEGANRMALTVPPPGAQMMQAEEEAAMAAQGGMPPGGAPPPMPGQGAGIAASVPPPGAGPTGMGATMDDLTAQAQNIAGQILTLDPTTRRSELINLKNQNPTVHALVIQMIGDMEQQGAQMGVQMMRQGQI
jgi:hypothetical protein